MQEVVVERLFDADIVEDPYPYYAGLRDKDPVHQVEGTNAFLVASADLIQEVVSDPDTYSSQSASFLFRSAHGEVGLRPAGAGDEFARGIPGVLATADPPDHGRQRKVLTRLFSSSALARREQEFRVLIDANLDSHLGHGHIEWMRTVAEPLPMVMVARILGLPDSDAPTLKEYGFAGVEQINGFASQERCDEIRDRLFDLGPMGEAYAKALTGLGPGDDTVIGACARAVHDSVLNDIEALSILTLVTIAGGESTTSLLGTGAYLLARDEMLQDRLRSQPALLSRFVEEACRFDPPFRGHYRQTTRATTLNGVAIPAGAHVVLMWPSANRDHSHFTRPGEIDVDRPSPRRHFGFGWGIHLCIGAPLARLEARVAFERLLARTSRLSLQETESGLRHHLSLMVRRFIELPLVLHR
ncbi:MAG TPA: cytochrome P450 [Acidimicrobiales bacterium]|nr:cytochrome P450 [Acidimicrobiales bacterium]